MVFGLFCFLFFHSNQTVKLIFSYRLFSWKFEVEKLKKNTKPKKNISQSIVRWKSMFRISKMNNRISSYKSVTWRVKHETRKLVMCADFRFSFSLDFYRIINVYSLSATRYYLINNYWNWNKNWVEPIWPILCVCNAYTKKKTICR